jgi:hypothetical protein
MSAVGGTLGCMMTSEDPDGLRSVARPRHERLGLTANLIGIPTLLVVIALWVTMPFTVTAWLVYGIAVPVVFVPTLVLGLLRIRSTRRILRMSGAHSERW